MSTWHIICVSSSDAIRLLLIYKYGGHYSDLDMVFLRSVATLANFTSGDGINNSKENKLGQSPDNLKETSIGPTVANAMFHFDAGHEFIQRCLEHFQAGFRPEDRLSGGPLLFTRVFLMEMCGMPLGQAVSNILISTFNPERCKGINILPQTSFYYYGWFSFSTLYSTEKLAVEWERIFKDSYGVHMYSSSVHSKRRMLRPRYYGKEWPAYLYLAINHCPLAYYSEKSL